MLMRVSTNASAIAGRVWKMLVICAKDTARGIAGEDLTSIRARTRFRKPQRAKMSGRAFAQLRAFVTYKAILGG
ncbi:MAG: hypothetical protein ACLPSH_14405 [Vulcanimicrobiaceae bacterium]